ncbi:MAG: hypothetical protein JWM71_340 [Solirubrobacteraceae bacterium]|nr:hypothetical protein [Solirubrobacteraceae bacterium]
MVLIGGCGGGGGSTSKKAAIAPQAPVAKKVSLLGASGSAGNAASYAPTGDIVADSGFRPDVDGFGFENYGNDVQPENMTAYEVEDIFGPGVCVRGDGTTCELSPLAAKWMDDQNQAMDGGHCMGFSVTALRMFGGSLKPATFGAGTVPDLKIGGNTDLQSSIAEGFAYQDLDAVKKAEIGGTPNQVLQRLTAGLRSGTDTYTMLIFGKNGKPGGHAITPFAVEDQGGGKVNVLVYDNNFPDVVRAVHFDTKADTWEYRGGINPSDLNERYFANAADTVAGGLLRLAPTGPGDHHQPFPFAGGLGDGSAGSAGSATEYDQITLQGSVTNHAHLLITDDAGHRMGFVGNKLVDEIPGATVLKPIVDTNLNQVPEPTYQIPVGLRVKVHIDGSGLTKPDKEKLTYIGPGLYLQVLDIDARPGDTDVVHIKGGTGGLAFSTNDTKASAPYIGGGLVDTKNGSRATYAFVIKAVDVKGASNIGLVLEPKDGYFGVAAVAHPGKHDFGYGTYAMAMVRQTPDGRSDTWSNGAVRVEGPQKGSINGGAEVGVVALIGYNQKNYTKADKVPVLLLDGINNHRQPNQQLTYAP